MYKNRFQWSRNIRAVRRCLGLCRLMVLVVSIFCGWYNSLADCALAISYDSPAARAIRALPVPVAFNNREPEGGSEASGSSDPAPAPVAAAAAPAEVIPPKNQVHLVSNMVSDRFRLLPIVMIEVMGQPSEAAYVNAFDDLTTQVSTKEWWVKMATCEWNDTVFALAVQLTDGSKLQTCGFDLAFDIDECDVAGQYLLADSTFSFVLAQMVYQINEGRIYSETLPYCAGGLLSHEPQQVKKTFQYLEQLFVAVTIVEHDGLKDQHIESYVTNAVWPDQTYSREILVNASECNFEDLPDHMWSELKWHSYCKKTSRTCEANFRVLNEKDRQHTASTHGRVARWHHSIHSDFMVEDDQPRLVPTLEDRSRAAANNKDKTSKDQAPVCSPT